MTNRKFTITYGRTINLGHYQSERIELTREFDDENDPGHDQADRYAHAFDLVELEVLKMIEVAQNGRDKAKANAEKEELPF